MSKVVIPWGPYKGKPVKAVTDIEHLKWLKKKLGEKHWAYFAIKSHITQLENLAR